MGDKHMHRVFSEKVDIRSIPTFHELRTNEIIWIRLMYRNFNTEFHADSHDALISFCCFFWFFFCFFSSLKCNRNRIFKPFKLSLKRSIPKLIAKKPNKFLNDLFSVAYAYITKCISSTASDIVLYFYCFYSENFSSCRQQHSSAERESAAAVTQIFSNRTINKKLKNSEQK